MVVNNYYYSTPPQNFYDGGSTKPVINDIKVPDPVSNVETPSPEEKAQAALQAEIAAQREAERQAEIRAAELAQEAKLKEQEELKASGLTGLGSNLDLLA